MPYPVLQLKSGKEANVGFRHPWVFSGALESVPESLEHGSLVSVADRNGRVIGTGTFSSSSSIAVRVFSFGEAKLDRKWFAARLREADERRALLGYGPETHLRQGFGGQAETTGYRVCHGEADGLPGLIVDRYGDVIVAQLSTAGLDRLRDEIFGAIKDVFSPSALVERSDTAAHHEEGLPDVAEVRSGKLSEELTFSENGLTFAVDPLGGQKTGFFLDQKDLRRAVRSFAEGREALNLFSYTGATGVAAMKGGAKSVLNVDSSVPALEGCARNAKLNKIPAKSFSTETADVFQWLTAKTEPSFDLVLMDPPALIKSRHDAERGKQAYHFLNRAALRLVRDGGIFVTSSCSLYFPEDDFAFTLRRASVQEGLRLDVLSVVRQSPDHPVSVYFPESSYLKSFVCRVTRR